MKTKFKIIITSLLISLYSCNDLEEEVFSSFLESNFYETEAQLATQSLGLYESFRHTPYEWFMFELVSYPSKYNVTFAGSDFWKKTVYAIDETGHRARAEAIWRVSYESINRANKMIKEIPNSGVSEELKAQYIAEARWMRAYNYFTLVRFYGGVPIYTTPTETADFETLFRGRGLATDVYDLIIEDLIFAEANLPVTWTRGSGLSFPRGRAVKSAATLLLGKVYLTTAGLPMQRTENYRKAIDVLKPLADNPGDYDVELLSNWSDIFSIDNEGNKEVIFALHNTYEASYGGVLPFVTTPRNSSFASRGSYFFAHSPDLLDLYEETDVRLTDGFINTYVRDNNGQTVTYNPNRNNFYGGINGICGRKYIDPSAPGNNLHSKDVIIYRYADVFLMLAEAYNEENEPANALNYLNVIRNRVSASDITTTDQALLRQEIRDERSRELYAEYTELFDMRRWGTAQENFENHPTRLRRAPELAWDPKHELYPIPPQIVSINTNLTPYPEE